MKAKPYNSLAYLQLHFLTLGKSIDKIAEENKVSPNTIRTQLKKHGLIR